MTVDEKLYFARLLGFLADKQCMKFEEGYLELVLDKFRSDPKRDKYLLLRWSVKESDSITCEFNLEEPLSAEILVLAHARMPANIKPRHDQYLSFLGDAICELLRGADIRVALPQDPEVLGEQISLDEFATLDEVHSNLLSPVVYCKKVGFQSPIADLIRFEELLHDHVLEDAYRVARGELVLNSWT